LLLVLDFIGVICIIIGMSNDHHLNNRQTWNVNGKTFTFFHREYSVGCGGDEIPLPWERKHYLYVWDKFQCVHAYYCFEDDLFIEDTDAPWLDCNRVTP